MILGAEAHGAELLARVKGFEAADKGLAPKGPSGRSTLAPGRGRFPRSSRRWGRQDAPVELPQEVPCPRWLWSEVVEYVGE